MNNVTWRFLSASPTATEQGEASRSRMNYASAITLPTLGKPNDYDRADTVGNMAIDEDCHWWQSIWKRLKDCWNVVIDVKVMAKQSRSQDECIIKIVEMMSLTLNSRRSLIKDKEEKWHYKTHAKPFWMDSPRHASSSDMWNTSWNPTVEKIWPEEDEVLK